MKARRFRSTRAVGLVLALWCSLGRGEGPTGRRELKAEELDLAVRITLRGNGLEPAALPARSIAKVRAFLKAELEKLPPEYLELAVERLAEAVRVERAVEKQSDPIRTAGAGIRQTYRPPLSRSVLPTK